MKYLINIILLASIPFLMNAQGKKIIAAKDVKTQTVYEYFLEDGANKPLVEKIERYDQLGNMTEQKVLNREGGIKSWQRWEYDKDSNMTKEETLDEKGRIEEKTVYIYDDGLLSEKQYFDRKGRLYKRKEYKYEYW